jgi:hypothetical protein
MGWYGPMTLRQFEAWEEWDDEQWNRPDRSDHYQMQTTVAMLSKNPGMDKLKIKFEKVGPRPPLAEQIKQPGMIAPPIVTKEMIAKFQQMRTVASIKNVKPVVPTVPVVIGKTVATSSAPIPQRRRTLRPPLQDPRNQ